MTFQGKVLETLVMGKSIFKDGEILGEAGPMDTLFAP